MRLAGKVVGRNGIGGHQLFAGLSANRQSTSNELLMRPVVKAIAGT